MKVCAAAAAEFAREFGGVPEGVWCAPGRVNLIGEHVDYAGGLCLPLALPQVTAAAVRRRDDGTVRLVSEGFAGASFGLLQPPKGRTGGWAAYVAGVIHTLDPPGFAGVDVAIASDVPVGAGLSSSAALEAAVALALAELYGLPVDDAGRAALAAACTRAENDCVGAPTGGMDQQVALRGRAGRALLLDCATGAVEHIPIDLESHGLALLVVDTDAPHRLVDGPYGQRRRDVEEAARRLGVTSLREVDTVAALDALTDPVLRRRAGHVVTEIARVRAAVAALRDDAPDRLGPLLDAAHRSLRDDFEVSSVELDSAVDAARAAGALGARMVGGGFGGSAIALCRATDVAAVAEAVTAAARERDLPRPKFLRAVAAAGARRCS
ncbi:galactokinase [Rhodococcus aetherivorans]|uniref:galactokinase n=1 Tax=Rhodococcus aetherivorans TaxID=191292 RepID=UPI0002D23B72|nr:galactokinase [Rhodococcus aetherivorans]MBC2588975.1 galactokinase [Rhodococcus aetherivorans]MDV6293489.1 galactokinase [Rhodococcus aetherivorans]CCW14650.1 Galactokinase [Rhodococcus aetherivorans]